jgi:hypothetical protein
MNARLEIKGKKKLFEVASVLLDSGYSIHIPYLSENDCKTEDEAYYVLEYSLTKYEAPRFILEEE